MINVSANGDLADIRIQTSSGYPELDAAAIDATKHWVFIPAAKDGVPQSEWTRVPVSFYRANPVPPPQSPDSLKIGVATEADARALMGAPGGIMRYSSGVTQLIWGNKDVGMVVLTFNEAGTLTKVNKSKPR